MVEINNHVTTKTFMAEKERRVTDDLTELLLVIPADIVEVLEQINRNDDLVEIIMDLGRVPTARYTDGEYVLLDREITQEDIDAVLMQIGDFDADNRSGIERTLHRISGLRNRRGEIVGLTMRVGRAVYGTVNVIKDIIESGDSILFLGRPGVGKTTMLREAARTLAETKRVVIVDTSNEIGGDGDVPHPAVGKARRMQVPTPNLQHEVMIEAVENHNPEVIIIDEIGRELEALAARTIAERGVQLIATAHGISLDNLLLNPTLSDLVGGVESVTLSDEEARRRGTQKTVLERRSPPTFSILIELEDRNTLHIHSDVTMSVDMHLRGRALKPEIRTRSESGEVKIEPAQYTERETPQERQPFNKRGKKGKKKSDESALDHDAVIITQPFAEEDIAHFRNGVDNLKEVNVYPYGIARNRLIQSANRFHVPLKIVEHLEDSDLLLTLKNFYRRRPRLVVEAEQTGVPIYILRSNTVAQIEEFLIDQFQIELSGDAEQVAAERAISEAEEAVQHVLNGRESVDLTPQKASIRRKQHDIVRQAGLYSHSYGREPTRHVRVYRV